MRYSGSLVKKEREQIFALFQYQDRIKFSVVEKSLKIRSNLVSYHLAQLCKEGLLEKKGQEYSLTERGEKYIPIFSHVIGEDLGPLPVALIAICRRKNVLMIKRNKRPYKGWWTMVGGKMKLEESVEEACLRLVKSKTGLDGKFVSTNAVFHERVKRNIIKHSFFLLFSKVLVKEMRTKTSEHGELRWFTIKQLEKERVVPSDLWLLQHKWKDANIVTSAVIEEKDDTLTLHK